MSRPPRRPVLALLGLLLAPAWVLVPVAVLTPAPVRAAAPAAAPRAATERPLPLKIQPAGVDEVSLVPLPAGGYAYRVVFSDGRSELLSPEEFAALLYRDFSGRSRLYALFNITSPIGIAWVTFGFVGQILFAGRMVVQWVASERRRRSVVPVSFWWLSLAAATMLMLYFVWRKDIVGVAGQATGWLIYVRNLRLIYRGAPSEAEG